MSEVSTKDELRQISDRPNREAICVLDGDALMERSDARATAFKCKPRGSWEICEKLRGGNAFEF